MQCIPPVDTEFNDRQVDHAHQGQNGAGAGASGRVVERPHQRDVPEIQEEQHQHRGQPGIPYPPGAPHRLTPQAAGGEAKRGEASADRGNLGRCDIGQRMPPDQRHEADSRDGKIPRRSQPRGRHVDIHDARGVALLPVGRRPETDPTPGRQSSALPRAPSATATPVGTAAGTGPDWRNDGATARSGSAPLATECPRTET